MAYDQPDSGAGFKPSDHPEWIGQVFLIWPTSEETVNFKRDDGSDDPTLMVTADVAIITVTDPVSGRPVFIKDAKIGGKALAGTIRPNKPNRKILGVLQARQATKGKAYHLDVPDSASPQWAQMCSLAEQYEAQYPRAAYTAPDNGGTPAWQQNNHGAAQSSTASGWSSNPAPAPNPPAPSPQPAQLWAPSAPAAALTDAAGPAWGAPAPVSAPPAAPDNGVSTWPAGLADFLAGRGYDVAQIPNEGAARQLAATLSN